LRARFYRGNGCAYTHTHTHLISLSHSLPLSLSLKYSLPLTFFLSFSLSPKHTLNLSFTLFHPSFSLKRTHTHSLSLSLQYTHSISPSMSPTRFPLSIKAVSDFERFEKWWQKEPPFISYFLSICVLFHISFLCFLLSFRRCIVSNRFPLFSLCMFLASVYEHYQKVGEGISEEN
jgi:hypothetical protein